MGNHQAEAVKLRLFCAEKQTRRILIRQVSALQGRTGARPAFLTADPLGAPIYGALGSVGGV